MDTRIPAVAPALLAAGLALTGCAPFQAGGSTASIRPTASPASSATPSAPSPAASQGSDGAGSPVAGNRTVLTAADAGKSVTVRRGDIVEVQLSNRNAPVGSSTNWEATSSDSSILKPAGSHSDTGTPAGSYIADFLAIGTGTVHILAVGKNTCDAVNPDYCQDSRIDFTVTVT